MCLTIRAQRHRCVRCENSQSEQSAVSMETTNERRRHRCVRPEAANHNEHERSHTPVTALLIGCFHRSSALIGCFRTAHTCDAVLLSSNTYFRSFLLRVTILFYYVILILMICFVYHKYKTVIVENG